MSLSYSLYIYFKRVSPARQSRRALKRQSSFRNVHPISEVYLGVFKVATKHSVESRQECGPGSRHRVVIQGRLGHKISKHRREEEPPMGTHLSFPGDSSFPRRERVRANRRNGAFRRCDFRHRARALNPRAVVVGEPLEVGDCGRLLSMFINIRIGAFSIF